MTSQVVEKLKTVQEILDEIMSDLAGAAEEEPTAAPEKPDLKLEDVRAKLAEKSRAGHTSEIRELLIKHGASKLSEVDPVEYQTILAEVEAL